MNSMETPFPIPRPGSSYFPKISRFPSGKSRWGQCGSQSENEMFFDFPGRHSLRGVVLGTSRSARQGGIAEGKGPERTSVGRTSHKQTRRLTTEGGKDPFRTGTRQTLKADQNGSTSVVSLLWLSHSVCFHNLSQDLLEFLEPNGLAEIVIHPGGKACLPVFNRRRRRQSNNP